MISPLFSKACTQRCWPPSAAVARPKVSSTSSIARGGSSARLRSWRGEKQTTWQVPATDSVASSGSATAARAVSGRSAAKSFSNTNVPV
jgi:hypothetical protein